LNGVSCVLFVSETSPKITLNRRDEVRRKLRFESRWLARSGAPLDDAFSIDHFLPWSFVAHDLLWNLTPVFGTTNSKKGDALPNAKHVIGRGAHGILVSVRTVIDTEIQPVRASSRLTGRTLVCL
jgi:HNH endonuclease